MNTIPISSVPGLSDSSFYFPFAFSPGSAVASVAISRSAIANENCVYRIGFDVVANRDVGKPSGDMPLDGFCKRFLCGFCGHRQRMIEAVVDGWRRWRLCYDPWFWPRPRPLWRIDVEMLGTIAPQQSLLVQPHCLAAYRRAQAVQPFRNLRCRMCRPQGSKFAQFLVCPAGHGRSRSWLPQRLVAMNCRFVRRYFGNCLRVGATVMAVGVAVGTMTTSNEPPA